MSEEEFPKIMIAIPTTGSLEYETLQSIMRLPGQYYIRFNNLRPLSNARNELVKTFLESEDNYEYIFFVDSDVLLPPNTWKLLDDDKDIISGLYPVWIHDDIFPCMFWKSRPGYWKAFKKWENNKVVEVDAVGAGALLVKREVFESIDYPWFRAGYYMEDCDRWNWGEDMYFSELVKKNGYKIFVDTGVTCNHYAKVPLMNIINIMRATYVDEKRHEDFVLG